MIARLALACAGIAVSALPARACALALAFALDISSSVNSDEYVIQKDGLASALRDAEVRELILAAPGSVTLMAYEWSGWQQQDLIADWTVIESAADLDIMAGRLNRHQRRYAEFSTALGRGLAYGAAQFARLPTPCAAHVIDVSGDGVNNEDTAPDLMRAEGRFFGLTINALVIDGATPDPVAYYRENVLTGPGAFMMVARNGFDDYPDLIKGKLVRELTPSLLLGRSAGESLFR